VLECDILYILQAQQSYHGTQTVVLNGILQAT
jgi:hypothetical protein